MSEMPQVPEIALGDRDNFSARDALGSRDDLGVLGSRDASGSRDVLKVHEIENFFGFDLKFVLFRR